jgi:hypothetical protein
MEAYKPWIVPHRFEKDRCYCILTKDTLNKVKEELDNHVNGRCFKNKLAAKTAKKKRYEDKLKRKEVRRASHLQKKHQTNS